MFKRERERETGKKRAFEFLGVFSRPHVIGAAFYKWKIFHCEKKKRGNRIHQLVANQSVSRRISKVTQLIGFFPLLLMPRSNFYPFFLIALQRATEMGKFRENFIAAHSSDIMPPPRKVPRRKIKLYIRI